MSEKNDNTVSSVNPSEKEPFPVKRLVLSVLAGAAAFVLCWCCYYLLVPHPTDGMTELAGVYTLAEASRGDITLAQTEGAGIAEIELGADGRCGMTVGMRSLSGRWTLAEDTISLRCGGVKLIGTVSGNALALNEAGSSEVTLVFTRGAAADSAAIPAGKYTLTAIDDNGTAYTGSVIGAAETGNWYISVKRDGSGSALLFSDEAEEISVDGRCIVLRGMRLGYTLDRKTLTVDYPGGIMLTFER